MCYRFSQVYREVVWPKYIDYIEPTKLLTSLLKYTSLLMLVLLFRSMEGSF